MKLIHTLLLSLSLIAPVINAEDCVDCTPELKPFNDIVQNIEDLEKTTVVNCQDHLKAEAKNEYMANFGKLPKQNMVIKGFNLQGSAEELKFLKKMLGEKPTSTWTKAKGCKTVLCALTNVYDSEEAAHRSLNIAKRDGYIISIAKDFNINNKEIGQLFKPEEIQMIDLAYKKLPPTFRKLKSLDRIKRLPSGYSSPRSPDAAAYASPAFHSKYFHDEGEITFLDGAFTHDHAWGPHAAVHELTHHVDFSRVPGNFSGLSEGAAYLKLSGWKKVQSYTTDKKTGKKTAEVSWTHAPGKEFVSDYAASEPGEDFAESVAHYLYTPEKLKAIDPAKYEFIKKHVYAGKEFHQEINLPLSEDEIFNSCIENGRTIMFYGKKAILPASSSNTCLNKLVQEIKITDPKLCDFNRDQIKKSMYDRIEKRIERSNQQVEECAKKLPDVKNQCLSEGNFQLICPIEKCEIESALKKKVHDSNLYHTDKMAMDALEKKIGKNNLLATALIHGLSDKKKIAPDYKLNVQRYFVDNAALGLAKIFEQQNFKFDPEDTAFEKAQQRLMMDSLINASILSFQETVLLKATKSKEKNLVLIKAWAASQSLEDTPLFEELAETLRPYK